MFTKIRITKFNIVWQACTAYYGCPHCEHVHLTGLKKPVYGGFRRFLPEESPCREKTFVVDGQRYTFRDVESRSPPASRTDESAAECVAIATPKKPFRGHKGLPFLSMWTGVDWEGNACDIMHDLKNLSHQIGTCEHCEQRRYVLNVYTDEL